MVGQPVVAHVVGQPVLAVVVGRSVVTDVAGQPVLADVLLLPAVGVRCHLPLCRRLLVPLRLLLSSSLVHPHPDWRPWRSPAAQGGSGPIRRPAPLLSLLRMTMAPAFLPMTMESSPVRPHPDRGPQRSRAAQDGSDPVRFLTPLALNRRLPPLVLLLGRHPLLVLPLWRHPLLVLPLWRHPLSAIPVGPSPSLGLLRCRVWCWLLVLLWLGNGCC